MLTTGKAACVAKTTPRTVHQWALDGRFRTQVDDDGNLLIDPDDFAAFLDEAHPTLQRIIRGASK